MPWLSILLWTAFSLGATAPQPPVTVERPTPSSPSSAEIYEALDSGRESELLSLEPETLLATLRTGRNFAKPKAFDGRRPLVDGYGRETELYLIVPQRPRGVLFVLHGLGGTGVQLKDRLFKRFATRERLIIAAPSARPEPKDGRNEDYELGGKRLPHWWCYRDRGFVLTALAELKRKYDLDENRIYLAGYSMGGFGTWNIGLRYPDRFAALVPMAGGISRHEYAGTHDLKLREILQNAFHVPVYAVHGSDDKTVPPRFDRLSHERLKELKVPHVYREVEGGRHILRVREGGTLMDGIQKWLRPKVRNPHPQEIRFHSPGAYARQCFWVRIDERSATRADVTATVKENKIELQTQNVTAITVYLEETHIDLDQDVEISWNGSVRHTGKVKPETATILESWKSREDRQLLYRAKVTLRLEAK